MTIKKLVANCPTCGVECIEQYQHGSKTGYRCDPCGNVWTTWLQPGNRVEVAVRRAERIHNDAIARRL